MRLITISAIAAACVAATPAAAATTVTFDSLAHNGDIVSYGPTLDVDGYRFASNSLSVWGMNHPSNADPGGATLTDNSFKYPTTVTAVDGGLFDLISLDMADAFNIGWSADVVFTFTSASGTTTETVQVDNAPGLQTFVFNKTDLLSFRYLVNAEKTVWMQIDNVVLSNGDVLSGVPEPSTWAMMISGFSLVGAAVRRRKMAAVAG